MNKKINLLEDGTKPSKITYDTNDCILSVDYPKSKFKIGDKVVIQNIQVGSRSITGTTFVSSMQQYINNTYTVKYVFYNGDVSLEGCRGYTFAEEWLQPLSEGIFNKGDILTAILEEDVMLIFDKYESPSMETFESIYCTEINLDYGWHSSYFRLASKNEIKYLHSILAKDGKRWNTEKLQIEDVVKKFKRGDIVYHNNIISIFDAYTNNAYEFHGLYSVLVDGSPYHIGKLDSCGTRLATPEEQQILSNALKKENKRWNTETLEIESIAPKFKAGDNVRFKKRLILEVGKKYKGLTYSIELHNTREDILEVLSTGEFIICYNPIIKDWWAYLPEWLEYIVEDEDDVRFKKGDILTATKATADGKDITFVYDEDIINGEDMRYLKALCGGVYYCPFRKIKLLRDEDIKYWFNINNVRYASDEEIEKFNNDLKEIGKKWDAETLQVVDLDISEIVVDGETACEYLNRTMPDFTSLFVSLPFKDYCKYHAQITLQLMCEAWNKFDGFVADFNSEKQPKYFIAINKKGNITTNYWHTFKTMDTINYAFGTSDRATQFGTLHKELFKTAMGIK